MPWQGTGGFVFGALFITMNAPVQGGVYGLWRENDWIYIGRAVDIGARLLQHTNGDNECINRRAPSHFGYELISQEPARIAREAALIMELRPACNQRVG